MTNADPRRTQMPIPYGIVLFAAFVLACSKSGDRRGEEDVPVASPPAAPDYGVSLGGAAKPTVGPNATGAARETTPAAEAGGPSRTAVTTSLSTSSPLPVRPDAGAPRAFLESRPIGSGSPQAGAVSPPAALDPRGSRRLLNQARDLGTDHAAAIPLFEEAIRLDPGNAWAHCELANALNEMGRYLEAAEAARAALAIGGDGKLLGAAHYCLGRAYEETGLVADAIANYEASLRVRPSGGGAWVVERRLAGLRGR